MWKKTFAASVVLGAVVLGARAPAVAAEAVQDDWAVMTSAKGMDRNRDGMVSKNEFLEMMAKAYDMKAGAEGMTDSQMKEFLKWLYVGG